MTDGYYLCAFAVDCVSLERARVEWTVVAQGPDGNWYDWQGHKIHPFYTVKIKQLDLSIPDGWIEHIQDLAQRDMANAAPAFDLTEALGLHNVRPQAQPSLSFPRRL